MLSKYKGTIYYILGAVAIGILSNAVWEVFKPVSNLFFEGLLNVSTLGVKTFNDGIYVEIAKGFHERPSLELYLFFLLIIVTFQIFALFFVWKFDSNERYGDSEYKSIFPVWFNKRRRLVILFLCIVGTTAYSLEIIKQSYVNKAITYIEQSLKIVGPYIDDSTEESLRSKFASLKSKNDFENVVAELKNISDKNDAHLPEF